MNKQSKLNDPHKKGENQSDPLKHIELRDTEIIKETLTSPNSIINRLPTHISLKEANISEIAELISKQAEAESIVKQEKTHSKYLLFLLGGFTGSILTTCIAIVIALTNPHTDKDFLLKAIPALLVPQSGAVVLGYRAYCSRSKPKSK